MEFMPFSDIDNAALSTLFPGNPKEYERAHDHDGNELIYYKGHWYISGVYEEPGPAPLDYHDPDADDIYDLDYANY